MGVHVGVQQGVFVGVFVSVFVGVREVLPSELRYSYARQLVFASYEP